MMEEEETMLQEPFRQCSPSGNRGNQETSVALLSITQSLPQNHNQSGRAPGLSKEAVCLSVNHLSCIP